MKLLHRFLRLASRPVIATLLLGGVGAEVAQASGEAPRKRVPKQAGSTTPPEEPKPESKDQTPASGSGPSRPVTIAAILGRAHRALGLSAPGPEPGRDRATQLDLQLGRNLAGMDLSAVDLVGADLRGRDLRGWILAGKDLSLARLGGANMKGVSLEGTRLFGTTIYGTKGLDLRGALVHPFWERPADRRVGDVAMLDLADLPNAEGVVLSGVASGTSDWVSFIPAQGPGFSSIGPTP